MDNNELPENELPEWMRLYGKMLELERLSDDKQWRRALYSAIKEVERAYNPEK